MKTILTLVCLLWMCYAAQAQFTTTIHRTYTADNVNQVSLQLQGKKMEMRESKGSRVMVEITIAADVPNETMLKYLIDNGRYDLVQEIDPTTSSMTLSIKKNNNILVVKGKECKEEISYVIYLPSKIRYSASETETSSSNH